MWEQPRSLMPGPVVATNWTLSLRNRQGKLLRSEKRNTRRRRAVPQTLNGSNMFGRCFLRQPISGAGSSCFQPADSNATLFA